MIFHILHRMGVVLVNKNKSSNFFNYYDVFELFKLFNSNKNITFIFTARTSIFKSRYEQFGFEKTSVYDLNRLDTKARNELVRIFEEYGYYPKQKIGDNYSKYIQGSFLYTTFLQFP